MNDERKELEEQVFKWIEIAEEDLILANRAVAKRYPGEYKKVTKDDAVEAVKLAELTKQVIGEILEKDGFHFIEKDE